MTEGILFVLSAPSGGGKSTILKKVMADLPGLVFSVSHTTRPPRPGEKDGQDYHFVSREDFLTIQQRDPSGFLEWAEVHGNLYGTSREEVAQHLQAGRDVVLDIDVDVLTTSKELESINPFDEIFKDIGIVVKSSKVLHDNYDDLFKNKSQINYKLRFFEDVKLHIDNSICQITSFKYRVKGAGGHDIEGFSRSDMSQQEIEKILIGLHGGGVEVVFTSFGVVVEVNEDSLGAVLQDVPDFNYLEYENFDYSNSYLGQFFEDIENCEVLNE